jgi:hypothetical protein
MNAGHHGTGPRASNVGHVNDATKWNSNRGVINCYFPNGWDGANDSKGATASIESYGPKHGGLRGTIEGNGNVTYSMQFPNMYPPERRRMH